MFLAGTSTKLPDDLFTTYEMAGTFSVFTSNRVYGTRKYTVDIQCHSKLSSSPPLVQTFSIAFVNDASSMSDSKNYADCANDIIYYESNLSDFDLMVSENP